MKKIVLIIALLLGGLTFASEVEHKYTRYGTIIKIDENIASIEEAEGNIWEYELEGKELLTFHKGDKVKMKMFDNCTPNNIYDDEIEKLTIDK